MKTINFAVFAFAFTIIGVLYAPTPASASLLGDEVTISINGTFPNNPTTTTVGPGVEANFVGFNGQCSPVGEEVSVDIDDSQVWITFSDIGVPFFMCDQGGVPIDPIAITITDMDWVGQSGIITDIIEHPNGCGSLISAEVLGPHSVQIIHSGFFFSEFTECHFDIVTEHEVIVGGELLPIDSTALLLAAAQSPAWITSLTIIALGIGAFVLSRNPSNVRNIKALLRYYLDRF